MGKKITYQNVMKYASALVRYVEKSQQLPEAMKYDGRTFTQSDMIYATSFVLNNLKNKVEKDASVPSDLKQDKNSTGDKLHETISQKDYLDMSKRVVLYINSNKKIPNYVSYGKKKCPIDLYLHGICKVLSFYKDQKRLPSGMVVYWKELDKPEPPKPKLRKYGRSSKSGCDNRGQNNGYFCGPHMAQEIVRNLTGVVISQSKIASIMGTTSSGTGHYGIETFFAWFNKNYDYNLELSWKNFSDVGWSGIKKILESDNQDIGAHEKYRDTWGHYTNYDKVYDNTVDVHNSLGSRCNSGCYCGYTENRNKSTAERYLKGISQKSILIVTRVN